MSTLKKKASGSKVLKPKKTMRLIRKIKVRDAEIPVEASSDRLFWVHDGGSVKNLKELHDAIVEMSLEQFAFHTERNGNDFARWIRDVLLDPECADKVEVTKGQKEMTKVILKFV